MIEQRDILLVPFPFSDQTNKKVRPVIVISNNNFNQLSEDLIVIGITSNISKDNHTLPVNNTFLEEGELFDECCIKVENILRIDRQLIVKKIGKLNKEKFKEILNILDSILCVE